MHRGGCEHVVCKYYVIWIRKLSMPNIAHDSPRTNLLKILRDNCPAWTVQLFRDMVQYHYDVLSNRRSRIPQICFCTLREWQSVSLVVFLKVSAHTKKFLAMAILYDHLTPAAGLWKFSPKKYFLPPNVRVIPLSAIWIVLFLCLNIFQWLFLQC